MKTVGIYLVFQGECEEAFTFYQSIFGGDPQYFRWGQMPENDGPKGEPNQIVNVTMPISEHATLQGCDQPAGMGKTTIGTNFNVVLNTSSREETDRFFAGLVEGGHINMPCADTFWGAYFGMVRDKFGIHWMLSYELPK